MFIDTTVTHEISNLEKHEFKFVLIDKGLHLDIYQHLRSETTRHKFKAVDVYSRLHKRAFPSVLYNDIPFHLAPNVIAKAKEQIVNQIVFVKPNDR